MNFTSFITREWNAELLAGFPLLKSIPSSLIQAFLNVVIEQNRTVDFLVRFSENRISKTECDSFWREIMEKTSFPEYMGFRENRQLLKMTQNSVFTQLLAPQLEKAKTIVGDLTIPTAAQVRKALFPQIASLFSSRPENFGGGNWRFPLQCDGANVWLFLDFGGMNSGFRWNIDLRGTRFDNGTYSRLSYERLMGIPDPHWDQVCDKNLEATGKILCSVIKKTLEQIRGGEGSYLWIQ